MSIQYKVGDALNQPDDEKCYIIHICNNIGGFGSGIAGAIAKKWPVVKQEYKKWFDSRHDKYHTYDYVPFELGQVQMVRVTKYITVINMIAQHGIGADENGVPPIRYEALENCLKKLAFVIDDVSPGKIVSGRLGAGLAGGSWTTISSLLEKCLIHDYGFEVIIYDLPNNLIPFND